MRLTLLTAVVLLSSCRGYEIVCAVEMPDGSVEVANRCEMIGEVAVCDDRRQFIRPTKLTCAERDWFTFGVERKRQEAKAGE